MRKIAGRAVIHFLKKEFEKTKAPKKIGLEGMIRGVSKDFGGVSGCCDGMCNV